ncbi:MAG TPA: hypothetical protein VNO32_57560 [Candidatus Acidoferrum sp.]|jgi:hypothetical protein|nr:hypothetical protein [Candidatus Acidoferrum sp.]
MNNHSPITIIVAALALAVLRIVLKHPALLRRQVCITDMLWHIGIGQRPYQVTATLGYDNLDERFIQLAGESRSLLPDLRQAFQAYNLWTEGEGQFWVFWKPAPPLFFGFFIVGFCLVRTHNHGVLLVALLPLLSVLLLLLVHSVSGLSLCLSVGGDGDAIGASAFAIPSACRNSQSMIDKKY